MESDRLTVCVSNYSLSCTRDELEEMLEEFLEKAVGKGRIRDVYVDTSFEIGKSFVQFKTEVAAARVVELGKQGNLMLLNCKLIVEYGSRNLNLLHSINFWKDSTLYIGNVVSESQVSWQWQSNPNMTLRFDFSKSRVEFKVDVTLNESKKEYKMESSYETIESVQLVDVNDHPTQAFLVQLKAPPYIYEQLTVPIKPEENIGNILFQEPVLESGKEQNLWGRTIDFTPNKSIGQCLAYVVVVASNRTSTDMSNLLQKFARIKKGSVHPPPPHRMITLKQSPLTFVTSQELVPILPPPPQNLNLDVNVLWKVNQLVQNSKLLGETLDYEFYSLLLAHKTPIEATMRILKKMGEAGGSPCFDPVKTFKEERGKLEARRYGAEFAGLRILSVVVTPTKVYFMDSDGDSSNRVTRHFSRHAHRFLRMSFCDEDLGKLNSTALTVCVKGEGARKGGEFVKSPVYHRVMRVLKEGFEFNGLRFEFLGFSSSQLREQSLWMFASVPGELSASDIRAWMGDFSSIRNVAKCAARMGQCFSSSTPTLEVPKHELLTIRDIERRDEFEMTTYCFSDGIGKISPEFARQVARMYKKQNPHHVQNGLIPSAFQIRYGGFKGVVALSPRSRAKLSLRPSMKKFDSEHVNLEILAASRVLPAYLNRQIIMLLATLGIKDEVFERMQQNLVTKLDEMMNNANVALNVLQVSNAGGLLTGLKTMLGAGMKPQEPYVKMMLQAFRGSQLVELRTRTHLLEPKGRLLMGCLDETKALDYGEVFIQVTAAPGLRGGLKDGLENFESREVVNGVRTRVVEGWIIVVKNPCLHPGDIRKLKARNVPGLHHMVDSLVFPQKGKRPHPNECSGSDLDGDLYFVSWNEELIPEKNVEPMGYGSVKTTTLDHPVTIEEIQEFFVNYIVNDNLGVISNAHTVLADSQPDMADSFECRELAHLVSQAVDFPKTGIPAIIPKYLRPQAYPNFMEKTDKPTYDSQRVLGKLWQQVKTASMENKPEDVTSKDDIVAGFDADMVVTGYMEFIRHAQGRKRHYDRKLVAIMDQYGIETEAEAVSGSIRQMSGKLARRKGDVIDKIRLAVSSLISEARGWFFSADVSDEATVKYQKASAWYYATYHCDYMRPCKIGKREVFLLSFPWVVYDVLLDVKKVAVKPPQSDEALPKKRRLVGTSDSIVHL